MTELESKEIHKKIDRLINISIPVLFAMGGILHFVYSWSGHNVLVGVFTPVNESIWEHTKLSFYPILIWWIVIYLKYNKSYQIDMEIWMTSMICSATLSVILLASFYYTYVGAFGKRVVIIDITSLLIIDYLVQKIGKHIYRYLKINKLMVILAVIVVSLFIVMFTVFTFATPHLPLFQDPENGSYGIIKLLN